MWRLLGSEQSLGGGPDSSAAVSSTSSHLGDGSSGGATGDGGRSFREMLEIPLAVLILVLYIVLGHTLELWKDSHEANAPVEQPPGGAPGETQPPPRPRPSQRHKQKKTFLCTFHESGPCILLGLAVGLMMNYGVGQQFDFDANLFFYVVLPPIIFHQGYALKKRNFFRFFHYIFSFGFLGTLIQFMVITVLAFYISDFSWLNIVRDDGVPIGLSLQECMLIAAVFSAADEVATLSLIKQDQYPKLSAVLFGEGVLNDAMSVLLFHAVRSAPAGTGDKGADLNVFRLLGQAFYLLVTAVLCGSGSALLVSRLLKTMPSLQTSPVRQTAIIMLGGYFSFSLSEALELSGILTVFFCGLTMSHYAWHSLGPEAQTTSKITSDTVSMIAEAYCFAAIGLSVHEFDSSQWCIAFILAMVLVVMIARAFAVYGICLVGGFFLPVSFSLPIAEQNVLFFGGLVRGAITWAQVVQVSDPHRGVMVTTSLGVIIFTVVVFGAVMPMFTRHLQPGAEEDLEHKQLEKKVERDLRRQSSLPGLTEGLSLNRNGGGSGGSLSAAAKLFGTLPSLTSATESHRSSSTVNGSRSRGGSGTGPIQELFSTISGFDSPTPSSPTGNGLPLGLPSLPRIRGRFHRAWTNLDEVYMKPWFGGKARDEQGTEPLSDNEDVGFQRMWRNSSINHGYGAIGLTLGDSDEDSRR